MIDADPRVYKNVFLENAPKKPRKICKTTLCLYLGTRCRSFPTFRATEQNPGEKGAGFGAKSTRPATPARGFYGPRKAGERSEADPAKPCAPRAFYGPLRGLRKTPAGGSPGGRLFCQSAKALSKTGGAIDPDATKVLYDFSRVRIPTEMPQKAP